MKTVVSKLVKPTLQWLAILIFIILFGISAYLIAIGAGPVFKEIQFRNNLNIVADAEVIQTFNDNDQIEPSVIKIRYRYLQNGIEYVGESPIVGSLYYWKPAIGEKIQVLISATQPDLSGLRSYFHAYFSAGIFLMMGIILLFSLVLRWRFSKPAVYGRIGFE